MQKSREKILYKELISTLRKSNKFCISAPLTLQEIPLQMDQRIHYIQIFYHF
jgi:hypothetical protein